MKLANWHEAQSHATQVLDINVNDLKALFRRAQCRRELMNYDGAMQDLQRAKDLAEHPGEVVKEMQRVKRLMKKYLQQEKAMYSQMFSS
jgi:tetratricopeptide (TPR) repeat protein